MVDSFLGPMVLLRRKRRDGSVDFEHLPALMVAWMLLDEDWGEEWVSAIVDGIECGSMTEWLRSV